jgi:hypothetical protein
MFSVKDDLLNAIERYQSLSMVEIDGKLSLSGEVELLHPIEKKLIDTFSVEITFPESYPFCFPWVTETSGKIERIADRHVFTNTNTLCFAVQTEERMKCRNGITLLWFINNVLIPRLAEEYIVNNGGKYEHEFSHGPLGDLEFYCEKFKTKEFAVVIGYLELILKGGFPKPHERCSCGSNVKFKKCHRIIFEELKALGDRYIAYEIERLEKFLEVTKNKQLEYER